jgi:hypothetical protein
MDVRVFALGLSGPHLVPSSPLATALLVIVLVLIAALATLTVADLVMVVTRRPGSELHERFVRWPYVRRGALLAVAAIPALLFVVALRLVSRSSLWTALVAVLLALALVQVARLVGQAPYGRSLRLPRRFRARPRPNRGLGRRSYLGWCRGRFGADRWALGAEEDALAVVGPPGTHKTAGVIVPNVAAHRGPVVATSVTRDVLRATARHRLALAETSGGPLYGVAPRVHVYEPATAEPLEGVPPLRWSPLDDCQDLAIARSRAEAAVAAATGTPGTAGGSSEDDASWRDRAVRILTSYLLAGALYPDEGRRGDISLLTEWLVQGPPAMGTVAGLLEKSIRTPDARTVAGWLRAEASAPKRELGSVFSFTTNALRAAAYDPVVRDNSARTEFSVDEFLLTGSTLYVLSPTDDMQSTAPFIAMIVDAMTTRAAQLHAEGRLPHPLLLALDDVGAVASLPSLPRLVADGLTCGVRTVWAARSRAALRAACGDRQAAALWEGTRARLLTGGLTDGELLQDVAATVAGKDEEGRVQLVAGPAVRERGELAERCSELIQRVWLWWQERAAGAAGQALLGPQQLHELPRGWGLLLHPDAGATIVGLPIAARQWLWRRQLAHPARPLGAGRSGTRRRREARWWNVA